MTRDEFSTKYKLLGLLRQGEGPTYSAEHRSTGRAVLVHFLPLDSPTAAMLPDLLSRLGPADAVKIIETLMVEGSPIVVSGALDASGSFEQWLRSRAGVPPLPAAPAASSASPASASSVIPAAEPVGGEFTKLFRSAEESPMGREPDRAPPELKPAAPSASGSFTALFQPGQIRAAGADKPLDASGVIKSAREPAAPAAPAAPADPPPATPPAPGSFTDLFHSSGAPGATVPPPPGGSAGPSVPMRSLRVSTPGSADSPPASSAPLAPPLMGAAAPPAPPLPPPRMGAAPPPAPLAAPVMHSPDLPAAPPLPAAGGANRGYVLPTMIAPEPHAGPMPHPAARPGRSDFTRIVSGRAILGDAPAAPPPPFPPAAAAAPPPAPAAPSPPSPPEAAKGSYLPLIIVLNVVLILAVGLVLYFALKR